MNVVPSASSYTSLHTAPADFPDSPLSQALRQPALLGLFLPIHHGGWSNSTLPRGTDWSFDYNAKLTLTAEALGFDLVFGVAQWMPKGGQGPTRTEAGLDSFIATASLASITSRILLVSTLHVLYGPWHPIHLAKFGATLDHISKGRWGINVVTGHRAYEHELFGWSRIEHDRRYELADEFVSVLKRLWTEEEPFSYRGQAAWQFKDAYISPRPLFGRPVLVNATGSDAGIDFAARHSDLVFVASPGGGDIDSALASLPAHTARLKQAARAHGRDIRTILNPLIVARETQAEAEAYAQAIVDNVDLASIAGRARLDSDAHAWRGHKGGDLRFGVGGAIGGNVQLIGSPEQIADQLVRLHAAGVDGFQLAFYDFEPDLAFFGARILPLLKQAGLRL
ncbi:LLM class flavin-dependent oxidoreductase [Ancylobacter oerskovii]|uniref:LLM class flavin-dependent oxidoreductase n=1 Tax=Ancylobacter oerskovii TaxID=459519 RepID=A0ABW4Z228_9HYPH|nr:LLM class flavin-dependent oxidoreductase [Ancylobacter oerskovii]MBS7544836.1 LLM class flavin-dependent oxidoreductase [Ancylobacter oerskovii]